MFWIESFGQVVAQARRDRNLSQYELADQADITRKTLESVERGALVPDPASLKRLGEALETDIFVLLQQAGASDDEIAVFTGRASGKTAGGTLAEVAPVLAPDTLDAAARSLAVHGIDISAIVELARYLSSDATAALLSDADYDALNPEMLEHLMPLLDAASKEIIFQKILDGELDYHLIECMLPYSEYLIQQIEAAVVYGVLDEGALKIVNEYMLSQDKKERH